MAHGCGRACALGFIAAAALMCGACSPYVYKQEINGFAQGVQQLGAAYDDARTAIVDTRRERQDLAWEIARAKLALTVECTPPTGNEPAAPSACALLEVGKPIPPPSRTESEAAGAEPIVRALRQYALALAAVANAADREALITAQTQFNKSVQGLAKTASGATVAEIGPALDLLFAIMTAALDQRRYEILRAGVTAANEPVSTLGTTLGDVMGNMRVARTGELRQAADLMIADLGPATASSDYSARLRAAREKVAALEAIRTSNPRQAARDMVAAHAALAKALNDDSRQVESVASAVSNFVDKATALKDAFAK